MVFLAALVPEPGRVFADHLADNPDAITFAAGAMTGDGPFGLTFESVRDNFYHDCPEALVSKAFRELRDQALTVFVEQCPIDRWPDTPSTYILMNDDRAVGGGLVPASGTGPAGRRRHHHGRGALPVLRSAGQTGRGTRDDGGRALRASH
jgi:hypothetical protein